MKNVLLVYLPFCTPASPPYSITHIYSFLKANCSDNIEVLDLNLEFHRRKFPEFQKYSQDISQWKSYRETASQFLKSAKAVYSGNNKKVVKGEKPEFFDEMLAAINGKKPDIVAFSIVYSSQAFYAYALIKELKGIITVVGGPAANDKLVNAGAKMLKNEEELLELILGKKPEKINNCITPDFSVYNLGEYFTPKPVIPLKTSTTCYYRKCAFCTHYADIPYHEFPLESVRKAAESSGQKHFFLIDDMIHLKRLLEIAAVMKPLGAKWACQLKPTKDFGFEALKNLRESGLAMIIWGVESGSDRVLGIIRKGTNTKDMEKVLEDSRNAGIINAVYLIFGFPTETKQEFLETIEFMKRNSKNIDLVLPSIFGLQRGTEVYANPSKFGVTKITEHERTVLEPRITYEAGQGLGQEEAALLRQRYKSTIEKINKFPKAMNFFREHMLMQI